MLNVKQRENGGNQYEPAAFRPRLVPTLQSLSYSSSTRLFLSIPSSLNGVLSDLQRWAFLAELDARRWGVLDKDAREIRV